ncbi:MAG TPA: helix-turn-helix domain-containing protein [Solirubrobacteraceae bacterium]|jgi:IclR family pca regulon transcriptional regulator|nr:helix-turn-helix domain-containing protein [Solirubrobacteraceae bacterium]
MPQRHQISITLSPAQVDQVVRAASRTRSPSLSMLLSGSRPTSGAHARNISAEEERRLSRSLLRGLEILTRFQRGSEERGIVELASELELSPSTTHRYVNTLVELGLLERCPDSRKYRLAEV